MLIVLDTNILCADFQLCGQAFRVFLETFRRTGNYCAVPAVVLDETIKAFERQLSDLDRKLTKVSAEWHRMTNEQSAHALSAEAIGAAAKAYNNTLRSKLAQNGIAILSYPGVTHEAIVRRAIDRSKPFRQGDAGYRDTLIWETILEITEGEREIAFISSNSKDFAENNALHSDLRIELAQRKPGTDVRLFASLAGFVEAILKPSLARLESLGRDFESGEVPGFSLAKWAETELVETITGDDWGHAFVPLDPDRVSCRLNRFTTTGSPTVDSVVVLPSGSVVVAATIGVEASISVRPHAHAEFDRDVLDFFGGDLSGDPSADYPATGTVSFTLMLAPGSHDVISVEIDTIETDELRMEVNPHPRKAAS